MKVGYSRLSEDVIAALEQGTSYKFIEDNSSYLLTGDFSQKSDNCLYLDTEVSLEAIEVISVWLELALEKNFLSIEKMIQFYPEGPFALECQIELVLRQKDPNAQYRLCVISRDGEIYYGDQKVSSIFLFDYKGRQVFGSTKLPVGIYAKVSQVREYVRTSLVKEKFIELASTDEVTGLLNQRALSVDLIQEFRRSYENEREFSLLFIDIDFFKKVNDTYGHVIGSNILMQLGVFLRAQVRANDSVYRYGGDEFVVLLRNSKINTVYDIAKRVLDETKEFEFVVGEDKDPYMMSISIGVAQFPGDAASPKEMLEFADMMMYKSKKSGRGKIFHVSEVEVK